MCLPAVLLFLIILRMSPGFAPMALTAGSVDFTCGIWYGLILYWVRRLVCSFSVRISCLGTSACSKMSKTGNDLGRSSTFFFFAACLTAWV